MSDKDEKIFFRLSTALRRKIKAEADLRGESESVIIREALREYFEDHPTDAPARLELNERGARNSLKRSKT